MTAWGVFETEHSVHVMPSDEERYAIVPHVASADCPCEPLVDVESLLQWPRSLWTHNEVRA